MIKVGGQKFLVPAICTNCVDSTGAGDYYAAGFLYGLATGRSYQKCGQIATTTAGRVCEVVGAKLSEEAWTEIRGLIALIAEQERC